MLENPPTFGVVMLCLFLIFLHFLESNKKGCGRIRPILRTIVKAMITIVSYFDNIAVICLLLTIAQKFTSG